MLKTIKKLIGDLTIMKDMDLKPNYTELAKKYGIDRHTVAKYYKQGKKLPPPKRNRECILDKYLDELKELFQNSRSFITKSAAYHYMQNKYGTKDFHSYSTFCHYAARKGIASPAFKKEAHIRYETDPGDMLQVDWKEDLKLKLENDEVIHFNLFAATYGYSRYHFLNYTRTKTTEDFLRCLIQVIYLSGGMPKRILTDNMSAVVNVKGKRRNKHKCIRQFEKDTGIRIELCRIRTPETKGKVESANRFAQWLLPYDSKLKSEQELIEAIETINKQMNEQINRTTGVPPVVLMKKEKEYLQAIPNKLLLETYLQRVDTQIVSDTLLVTFEGSGYSVSPKYIGKRVKLVPIDDKLYIYFNTTLIAVHDIKNRKFNYRLSDYEESLKNRLTDKNDEEIEKLALANLKRFEKL